MSLNMGEKELKYDRHAGFERVKTVDVPELPEELVQGLQPYEQSVLGYSILGFELLDETALKNGITPRFYFAHRPPTEQMLQIYTAKDEQDEKPERLTYFQVVGGRSIPGWTPVLGDNLRGTYRKGGTIFGMDLDGSELFQLWRYWEDEQQDSQFEVTEAELDNRPGRGRIERLTNDSFKYGNPLVSKSGRGKYLAFGSNMENNKDTKVYLLDLSSPGWDPVLIFNNPKGQSGAGSFSADEKLLLVTRSVSTNESPRFIVDLEHFDAAPKQLMLPGVDTEGPVAIRAAWFSQQPNSTEIFVALDGYGDFTSFVIYDMASNTVRHITTPDPTFHALFPIPWNVTITATPEYVVLVANSDGYAETYLYDIGSPSVKRLMLSGHESDFVLGMRADAANGRPNHFVARLTSPHFAASIVSVDISDQATPKVTPYAACQSCSPPFRTYKPDLIRYKSFDDRMIPAWVYKPTHVNSTAKLPIVIHIHGGPCSQVRPSFMTSLHGYLLNELGIAIIYPNVRGSSGYGKAYEMADDVFKREDSVKDIGALLNYIKTTMPELDDSRIAVMGASYGGYMTYACLFHYSPLIRCGLSSCGIANWITFLSSTHAARVAHRRQEYGDETDPQVREFLEKISPINHVDKFGVPLFISQGEHDTRVPLSEALMMYDKVKSKGLEVWLAVGEQEGHVFKQKSCIEFVNAAKAAFLKKWLLGKNETPQEVSSHGRLACETST